jgi:glucose/arabinose dehydrogenase
MKSVSFRFSTLPVKRASHAVLGALLSLTSLAILTLGTAPAAAQTLPQTVTMRNFFKVGNDSLTFVRPVLVAPYPDEDSTFIVLEQRGRIMTVSWTGTSWRKTDSAAVTVMGGTGGIDEQGLLGFAFHPDYATNRKYFVYFVDGTGGGFGGNTVRFNVLAERIADSSGRPATADVQRTIIRIRDPYDNHNGGTIGFDTSGALVLGIGDGGTTQGDPENRAQNPDSLHGKFLRFDVDSPDAYPADTTRNYAIPTDNPFKDDANHRPEIWSLGARNPWKWTFHPVTGEIWAGDVGQWDWEKITRVPKGSNLGWRLREGPVCFNPATNCPTEGLLPPALSLPSSQANSITGGVFFQRPEAATYHGAYIFGDYGKHSVWAARIDDDSLVNVTQIGSVNKVVSFDRDHQGNILATSISPTTGFNISSNEGRVLILESPDMASTGPTVTPTSLVREGQGHTRTALKPIALRSVLDNPGRYDVRHPDGRKVGTGEVVRGLGGGVYLVHDKHAAGPARVMTVIKP